MLAQIRLGLALVFLLVGLIACNGATTPSTVNSVPEISLVPIDSSNLPALHQPTVVHYDDYWLIMSGMTGVFHGFADTNPNIYVYKVSTGQIYSESIVNTDLPLPVEHQLTSVTPNFLRDGDTLYMIGGYYNYNPNESNAYTTLKIITSYNIPGMVNAIINQKTDLAQFVHYSESYDFTKNTGGQLGKIGNDYYLAFGQDCEGNYCNISQVYTNTVFKFSASPELNNIVLESSVTNIESAVSGFRRRDYVMVPFESSDGNENLFAMGGPFTPGNYAQVWTNGILIDSNLNYNDRFINQQANQYYTGMLSMYSDRNKTAYAVTFSGLSNTYWSESGVLSYDYGTPYGNILDVISYSPEGVREYANKTALCANGTTYSNCLHMGLDTAFVDTGAENFDSRIVLQLDKISSPTLVGYLYGGLTSESMDVFGQGTVTNQAYAVYIDTDSFLYNSWINITNRHPGVP